LSRPRRCRWVESEPNSSYFKPRGIPLIYLKEVALTVDEFEALRLGDFLRLEQDKAARRMKISRQTFGRILSSARKKIAEAIIQAKALKIEGGDYIMAKRRFRCFNCGHTWEVPFGTVRPTSCPSCDNLNIHRAEEDRGYARRGARGRGRGGFDGSTAK
jgi:predicted DNA-binding protein (UPF0251 family)